MFIQNLTSCCFGILLLLFNMGSDQSFEKFVESLKSISDSQTKNRLIDEYLSGHNFPLIEQNRIHFIYRGKAKRVAVPGELSQWDPSNAPMERIQGTDFFYRSDSAPIEGRIEYKLWVDSAWIVDPVNPRQAEGGFGFNSDLWMPQYRQIDSNIFRSNIPHGTIDTFSLSSRYLACSHPIFVYLPPKRSMTDSLPVIYVTDGGEYLSLGKMHLILDYLIATHRIRPVCGVFVDPRKDVKKPSTNMRMTEYSADDAFLDFLQFEVSPYIERHYPVLSSPNNRAILGASMGGLISAYAVLSRPDFINNSAAQSPSYTQAKNAVIKLAKKLNHIRSHIFIQTGTIGDTEVEAQQVSTIISEKGATVRYETFPEGHNWTNWRTHLPSILEDFFPPR